MKHEDLYFPESRNRHDRGQAQITVRSPLRTPNELVELVHRLGPIGLDPCGAPRSLVAARTEWRGPETGLDEEDGLWRSWTGRGLVYCFPPPSESERWAEKIIEEAGAGVEVVALLPSHVHKAWFQDVVLSTAAAVCYWRGALRCLGESDPVPTRIVAYWGARADRFRTVFASTGHVVLKPDESADNWNLSVPLPTPVGTWVQQQGPHSKAVRAALQRFASELAFARSTAECPPATEPRKVRITRYGSRKIGRQSLEQGGELVIQLLCDQKLLSKRHGYDIYWDQRVDRRRQRTDIRISRSPKNRHVESSVRAAK